MKNTFKFTTIVLAMSISSAAFATTGLFQWAGTVPNETDNGAIKIVNKGSVEHDAGTLIFKEASSAGTYNISQSSELIFGVQTVLTDTPVDGFGYELTNFKFSAGGGLMTEITDEGFNLNHDGINLAKNDPQNASADAVTLTVSGTSAQDVLAGGDEVVMQATILVSDPLAL